MKKRTKKVEKKVKDFEVQVSIVWSNYIFAKNKKEAIEIVKENFKQEYNIDLGDNEIRVVEGGRK
jgi:hypothetical protein